MSAATGYAKTPDGVHLAYTVTGNGPVDVLYSGGYTISIDSWDEEPHIAHMFRRLESFSRLIRYDVRGVGLSDPIDPANPPTVELLASDVLAVLDAIDVARVAFIADSGSGTAAIELAATRPDRLERLVLVNSAASYVRREGYPYGVTEQFLEDFLRANTDPSEQWSVGDTDDFELILPSRRDDPHFRDWWMRASRRGGSPATARALIGLNSRADMRARLPQISVPTLVLHSHNLFVPFALGQYLAENIPGAECAELETKDVAMWGTSSDLFIDEIEEFLTGQRGGSAERVLATVLFTDIVDSTGRAVALGDRAWRTLLDSHDAIVRAELARYGGRVVNTTGDGFFGAFDSPTQAVRSAGAIVAAAAREGVAVRVGVHTGECERRGDDLAGLTVHIAARVAALAATGEVLVSRTVRDLVAGSGIQFADRGEHELKGVPETWQLYALETR